jgi:hypothetical protein
MSGMPVSYSVMEFMARFEICAMANIKNAVDIKLYIRSLGLEVIGKIAIWEGEHKKSLWHYVLGGLIFFSLLQ